MGVITRHRQIKKSLYYEIHSLLRQKSPTGEYKPLLVRNIDVPLSLLEDGLETTLTRHLESLKVER